MPTFLVPLPATTSGSAPENKQFYFLFIQSCVACNIQVVKIRQFRLQTTEIKDETPGWMPGMSLSNIGFRKITTDEESA